jgi:putative heme-binding domain-containing protein
VDRQYGRIWRVVHESDVRVQASADTKAPAPPSNAPSPKGSTPTRLSKDLDLKKLSTADLVKTLEHPNNWMRRMARRMLVERMNGDVMFEVSKIAADEGLPEHQRTEATFTMASQPSTVNTFSPQFDSITYSSSSSIKLAFLRLYSEILVFDSKPLSVGTDHVVESFADRHLFITAVNDVDLAVRQAAVCALRQKLGHPLTVNSSIPVFKEVEPNHLLKWQADLSEEVTALFQANANADHLLSFSIWMLLEPLLADEPKKYLTIFATQFPTTQPLSRVLSHKAMRRLCDTRKAENLDLAVEFCDKIAAHDVLLAHALDGLVKGQEGGVIKPVKDVSASLAKWRASSNADVRKHAFTLAVLWGDEEAITSLATVLTTAKAPSKEVIEALQRLRGVKTPVYRQSLLQLLRDGLGTHGPEVAVAAIRAASELGGDEFIEPLLNVVQASGLRSDPQSRGLHHTAAIEALTSRETWTKAMLNAIAEKKVPASGFPAPVRRALATSKDKGIRDLAFQVLGAWQDSSDDVKSLIAQKKQACLTGEPDLANGKLMFTATCMICHEFHGGGQKVGPDLIGSGRSNLDALLANVIDPNQIIGNGYENITVSTKDGRTLAGRIVEDTPGHVKLLGAGGAAQIVSRDQIATLTNTKQSLMPMGFGNLPDAAFRDLIWYILAPPEEGPLTPEKKKLLIQGVELPETASQPKKTNWRAIDWESVSLWNPDWKVNAPDFERTPVKLAEYHGKTNVLLMHPFTDKKTPASLERQMKVEKTKLKFSVAADDRGDWLAKVIINGQEVKAVTVDHEKPRWKTVEVDLAKWKGQDITLRLEAHANGWAWEFAYWHGITLE